MPARVFIDRPIFAWVIALFIIMGGVLAIPHLPVAQYPNVARRDERHSRAERPGRGGLTRRTTRTGDPEGRGDRAGEGPVDLAGG
ncbi:efflux RND transporter permease subunit, partial [Archangium sp.]|uniref:efflux RND transporter permease subunit n=1 Tax=Archangium sp. TaxID=1872627 RepID=UPI002D69B607